MKALFIRLAVHAFCPFSFQLFPILVLRRNLGSEFTSSALYTLQIMEYFTDTLYAFPSVKKSDPN